MPAPVPARVATSIRRGFPGGSWHITTAWCYPSRWGIPSPSSKRLAQKISEWKASQAYPPTGGRAVVPSISPYRDNALSLDTRYAADNVELIDGGENVIPTHGAVVVRRFQTKVGRRAIVMLSLPDGKPAPFVASAWQGKEQVGMVADNGLLYLNGILAEGGTTLHVTLESDTQCQFELPVTKGPSDPWYQQVNAVCR